MKKVMISKERKYIIITGCVLLFIGIIYRFYPYMEESFSSNAQIQLRQKKIVKYREIASQRDYYENRFNQLNRLIERAESILLNGRTASLAAVDLQNVINDITERSGIEIKTMQVLKTENIDGGHYLRIPVEFSFESTIRQLKEILYKIEAHPKLLVVLSTKSRNKRLKDSGLIKTTVRVAGVMRVTGAPNT